MTLRGNLDYISIITLKGYKMRVGIKDVNILTSLVGICKCTVLMFFTSVCVRMCKRTYLRF